MLISIPPIFVADTKITYGYNFLAPFKSIMNTFKNFIESLQPDVVF